MIEIEKPHYSIESSPDALVLNLKVLVKIRRYAKPLFMKQLKAMKI